MKKSAYCFLPGCPNSSEGNKASEITLVIYGQPGAYPFEFSEPVMTRGEFGVSSIKVSYYFADKIQLMKFKTVSETNTKTKRFNFIADLVKSQVKVDHLFPAPLMVKITIPFCSDECEKDFVMIKHQFSESKLVTTIRKLHENWLNPPAPKKKY